MIQEQEKELDVDEMSEKEATKRHKEDMATGKGSRLILENTRYGVSFGELPKDKIQALGMLHWALMEIEATLRRNTSYVPNPMRGFAIDLGTAPPNLRDIIDNLISKMKKEEEENIQDAELVEPEETESKEVRDESHSKY